MFYFIKNNYTMNKETQNKFTILKLKKENQLKDSVISLLQWRSIIDEKIIKEQKKWIKEDQILFIIIMVVIFALWIFSLYINK